MTVWIVQARDIDGDPDESWIHEVHGTEESAQKARSKAQKDYDESGFYWAFFVESYPVIVEED